MTNPLRALTLLPFLATALAQTPQPVAVRIAAQNALFEARWEEEMKANPERATAYGDYRYNSLLSDDSLAALAKRHAADLAWKAKFEAIPTADFPEADRISHDLMLRNLNQHLADYALKNYEMPLSQMDGVHTELADLPLAVPLDTVAHYDDYIARLHAIPRVFADQTEVLRQGAKDGLMPVGFLLEKVPAQCEGVIAADPFLLPTKKYPASFSAADRNRLTEAMTAAVNGDVLPAYRRFADFVAKEYAPQGRTTLSIESLPNGKGRYANAIRQRTTTDMAPAAIHAIGLREIDRITALMTDIAHKEGYADLPAFRAALKIDAKYKPKSAEQIVDDFRGYIAQMEPRLPELFTLLPKSPVTVEAIPAFQAAMATHYQTGTPDGKRPGRVVVATSDYAERSLVDDEATAYHEGVPGHHLQLSVQQQMTGLPKFRQHGGASAYAEGWALYSEELGKEIGFYKDPVSDYGRLSSELFRAVRLVVDTGLHDEGWTRDQVVAFFRKSGAVDEPTIQAETDRYIAWPAQALSYKLGQLKIRELRERARTQLGPQFDIRRFHDEILNGGNLPLDLLEQRVDRWIAGQLPASASARSESAETSTR